MKKSKALVPTGFGLNCDKETKYSLEVAGFSVDKIHLNDLYDKKFNLGDYHILLFIGGFEHGDELGAGVVWANNFKDYLGKDLLKFIEDGKLIMGICNGFQAVVKMGVLPGLDNNYNNRTVSVTYNDSGNFRDQWVSLKINQDSNCVWTKGIDYIDFPIRHGEGKVLTMDNEVRERLKKENLIVMQYCLWQTQELADGKFPDNPNGSLDDIAGISDPTGRILGLMPHPEGYNNFTNHPLWTRQKYELNKQSKKPDSEGLGIKIFRNAKEYVQKNL